MTPTTTIVDIVPCAVRYQKTEENRNVRMTNMTTVIFGLVGRPV
jgi:hypothetical protein